VKLELDQFEQQIGDAPLGCGKAPIPLERSTSSGDASSTQT